MGSQFCWAVTLGMMQSWREVRLSWLVSHRQPEGSAGQAAASPTGGGTACARAVW